MVCLFTCLVSASEALHMALCKSDYYCMITVVISLVMSVPRKYIICKLLRRRDGSLCS